MKLLQFYFFLFFSGWFLTTPLSPVYSNEKKISNKDHIILAYYPPLMIDDKLEKPGLSIEIIQEAAKRLGRELSYEFMPFKRALKTLRHRNDAIQPALYRNPTREPDYQWIYKTHNVQNVFLTLDKPINSLEEARKLKAIGVETYAAMDVLLTNHVFKNIERVDRPDINVNKLRTGRIDAWALTKSLAQWTWKRAGETLPLVVGDPIEEAEVYVVAGKLYPKDTLRLYRNILKEMHQDGTFEKIINSYK